MLSLLGIWHPQPVLQPAKMFNSRINDDVTKLITSDFKVELIDDSMKGLYVELHGPKDKAGEMMLQDKATYEQRVREHCQRYAKPKEAAAAPEAQCSDGDASVEEEEHDGSSNEGARREPDP